MLPAFGAPLLNNIWPNSDLETDSDSDGIPDFWNRGGSITTLDFWTNNAAYSPTRSLYVNDNRTNGFGSWFSDFQPVTPGGSYHLQFFRRYQTQGTTRVTASYYSNTVSVAGAVNYVMNGTNLLWGQILNTLTVPTNANQMRVQLTSGGGSEVTGEIWIDDISLAPVGTANSILFTLTTPGLPEWSISGPAGTYQIQATENLVGWDPIDTKITDGFPFLWGDPSDTNGLLQRFYRIIVSPQ